MSSETLHGSSLDGFISIRQLLDTVWDVRIPSKHLALIGTIFAALMKTKSLVLFFSMVVYLESLH